MKEAGRFFVNVLTAGGAGLFVNVGVRTAENALLANGLLDKPIIERSTTVLEDGREVVFDSGDFFGILASFVFLWLLSSKK